jgi:hypothetical protein
MTEMQLVSVEAVKAKLKSMDLLFDYKKLVFSEFENEICFTYPFGVLADYSIVAAFFGLSEFVCSELIMHFYLTYVESNFDELRVERNDYQGWLQGQYLYDEKNEKLLSKVEESFVLAGHDDWFMKLGRTMDSDSDSFMCLDGKRRPLPQSLFGVMKFANAVEEAARSYREENVTFEELEYFVSSVNYIYRTLNRWKVEFVFEEREYALPRQIQEIDSAFYAKYITDNEREHLWTKQSEFARLNMCWIKDIPDAFVSEEGLYV